MIRLGYSIVTLLFGLVGVEKEESERNQLPPVD